MTPNDINELREKLVRYSYHYYVQANSPITDYDWDMMALKLYRAQDQLANLNTGYMDDYFIKWQENGGGSMFDLPFDYLKIEANR